MTGRRRIRSHLHPTAALGAVLALGAATALAQSSPPPRCPDATFGVRLLTPPALRIPRDAALVVGLFGDGTFRDLPPIALTRRRRQVTLAPEPIAPGLYRLRHSERRVHGRWELSGVPGAAPILFGRPGVGPAPIQPQIERVERYLVASGDESRTELRARFRFPIPEGVVAIVLYWGEDAQPDGFAPAVNQATEVVLFSGGDCPRLPAGASAPPESGRVRVAFVGRYGQLSPLSEPVTYGPS